MEQTTGSWEAPEEYKPDDVRAQLQARNGDLGKDIKTDASVAKVFATEAAGRVVDRCMQALDTMGMTHEMLLERWYRELRIRRVGEDPSEVQRMLIARDLLSGRKQD